MLDVIEAVPGTSLPDRVEASRWHVRLTGVSPEVAVAAVEAFLAADEVVVERLTKGGLRQFDARGPVLRLRADADSDLACATLTLVVRHVTPAVRPDDVLSGLRSVADLVPPVPPEVTRLAQGPLTGSGEVGDPLAPDRVLRDGGTRQADDRDRDAVGARPLSG